MAHEVNNPLAAARANVEWLCQEPPAREGGEHAEVLADTLEGLNRIAKAVARLQASARGAGPTKGDPDRVGAVDEAPAQSAPGR